MLVILGTRTARIKKYKDQGQPCKSCNAFDLEVSVYRDCFHIFFIPVYPTEPKSAFIRCNQCGRSRGTESLAKQYAAGTRTPFYLFSGIIISVSLLLLIAGMSLSYQKEKARYVDQPRAGDVYLIRKDEDRKKTYFFLLLHTVKSDTVLVIKIS